MYLEKAKNYNESEWMNEWMTESLLTRVWNSENKIEISWLVDTTRKRKHFFKTYMRKYIDFYAITYCIDFNCAIAFDRYLKVNKKHKNSKQQTYLMIT